MKRNFKLLTLLLTIAMFFCFTSFSVRSKASETTFSQEDISKQSSCVINGQKRTLTLLKTGVLYYNAGDETPFYVISEVLDSGFDKENGVIWVRSAYDTTYKGYPLYWCNPDWSFNFWTASRMNSDNTRTFITDISSLLYDDQGFVTGYKETSGTEYPILTLKELEDYVWPDGKPSPSPVPTLEPSTAPTQNPNSNIGSNNMVVPTANPPVSNQATNVTKAGISVKKSKSYYCLVNGEKTICKYKLKNGKLTFKRTGKKTLSYSRIKYVKYIKKSKRLVCITKNRSAFTISLNGKKKYLLKKGAQKILCKNGWAIKIKKTNGKCLNIRNK